MIAQAQEIYRAVIRWYIFVALQIIMEGETVLANNTVTDLFFATALTHTRIEITMMVANYILTTYVTPTIKMPSYSALLQNPIIFIALFTSCLLGSSKPCIGALRPIIAAQLQPQPLLNRGLNMLVDKIL